MALSDLPNELLLGFIRAIESERDMNSVIHTSKKFHALGNPHLYRNNARRHRSSALIWGAKNGRIDTVRLALGYGADVNAKACKKPMSTALILAAENNRLDIVKLLFENGADVNATNRDQETAVLCAARDNYVEVLATLLSHPAVDPDIPDMNTYTPLFCAVDCQHVNIIEELVCREDVNVNRQHDDGATPLFEASTGSNSRVTELLLSNPNIDPNLKVRLEGATPLMSAAKWGYIENMRLILDHPRTNLEEVDHQGRPLISYAVQSRNKKIVDYILDRGVDVNKLYRSGATALCQMAARGERDMIEFLISRGADPTLGNPILHAACVGNKYTAKLLLRDSRVTVTTPDNHGTTALHCVAGEGYHEVLELFLEGQRADVNVQDHFGLTPLMRAASGRQLLGLDGHARAIQLLLNDSRVDVNMQDNDGRTALFIAAEQGCKDRVKLLLQHAGIDSRIQDNTGKDPTAIAESNGHYDIAIMIATSEDASRVSQ
ncbi:ankyrin repeat-containing domain protein [Aspergillus unguis]